MPSAVQREDGSWLIDGMMPVDEFKDLVSDRTSPWARRNTCIRL